MPSSWRKCTACDSGSENSATSTLGPLASLRPAPTTWFIARCTTRAKPSVGCARLSSSSSSSPSSSSAGRSASRSSSSERAAAPRRGTGFISLSRKLSSLPRMRASEPPQCLITSAVFSSSSSASNRCSRPENSCPRRVASSSACRIAFSRSELNIRCPSPCLRLSSGLPPDRALQRHLVLPREADDLAGLGLGHVVGEHPGDAEALGVDVQHDLRRGRLVVMEELHEDEHDEFLRRVVVVVQEHLVKTRLLHLGLVQGGKLSLLDRLALFRHL